VRYFHSWIVQILAPFPSLFHGVLPLQRCQAFETRNTSPGYLYTWKGLLYQSVHSKMKPLQTVKNTVGNYSFVSFGRVVVIRGYYYLLSNAPLSHRVEPITWPVATTTAQTPNREQLRLSSNNFEEAFGSRSCSLTSCKR
jgi:hypothetical protein